MIWFRWVLWPIKHFMPNLHYTYIFAAFAYFMIDRFVSIAT